MGIHGDNAAEAFRHVMGLGENEQVSSTAHTWAAKEEVKARVKHLRMEQARKDSERVLVDRNKVIDRLWDVADRAKQEDKHSAETKALELLGKDAGMFKGIETGSKVEDQSDEELSAEFERLLRERALGQRDASEAAGDREGAEDSEASELSPVPEAG